MKSTCRSLLRSKVINSGTLEECDKDFRNTIFVNREEDCGLNGLRISKTSYHPNQLLKKSLIAIL